MRIITVCLICSCALWSHVSAQSIFGLNAVVGVNASQIMGDQLAGFDKVGLCGGLRGTVALAGKAGMSVELLYSERGSRPDIFDKFGDPDVKVTLQYLDLPVYVTYSDWPDPTGKYDQAFGALGLSYGRLIQASTLVDQDVNEQTDILIVKFGSDAYFGLVQGREDLREALAAGRYVIVMVAPGRAVLVADDEGVESFSPEQREQVGLAER